MEQQNEGPTVDEIVFATVANVTACLNSLRTEIAQRGAAIDGRNKRIEELKAAVSARDKRIEELKAAVSARDGRIESLSVREAPPVNAVEASEIVRDAVICGSVAEASDNDPIEATEA